MKIVQLLQSGKVLLNIDESWLNESDFRRSKWRESDGTNVVPIHTMLPRITVIVALDTLGNVYITLSQANSNNKTMEIYFHHLVGKLDRERPDWRDDTVLLLDGASYHKSSSTLSVFKSLRIPVMILGPHSYDIAVCELFFSFLKSSEMNPMFQPTGKK